MHKLKNLVFREFHTHLIVQTSRRRTSFFLFGRLTNLLKGKIFEDDEELFRTVQELLKSMPINELKKAYVEWIRRLQECIDKEGGYVGK